MPLRFFVFCGKILLNKRERADAMNRCIKCGREIPDGELFCIECSLNPGSSLFEEPKPVDRRATPVGRMQTPKPVRRPAPQPVAVAQPPRRNSGHTGLKVALALVSLLLAALIAFVLWQYRDLKVERTRLETKEADMLLREKEKDELQEQLEALQSQLDDLNATIEEKDQQISTLTTRLSGSQSSQSQSEYDLTTAQAELERLEEENEQLLLLEQELEENIQTLTEALTAAEDYKVKADFMDSYVVFVENNGTGVYHTYDCEQFSKSNFWAYSRKLAESNGFSPCQVCGGKP